MMATCFVIQPFDAGKFDKRYEDVFAPAISAQGLEPYRVDRDPGVTIPIEDIQTGIESAAVCLADITTDNPNVWFELGYAIAAQKEVILVCSDERESKYPFDVQHRSVVKYSTESPRDFEELKNKIMSRLKATLQRSEMMGQVGRIPPIATVEGLGQHEIATLVAVAEQEGPEEGVSAHQVRVAMENAGFTKLAAALGVKALIDKMMLAGTRESDYDGTMYLAYHVTPRGIQWLYENQSKLALRHEPRKKTDDDELPF